jgi:hypothetical protein
MNHRARLLVSLILGHWVVQENSSAGSGTPAFFLLFLVCWTGPFN